MTEHDTEPRRPEPVRILIFPASLRADALNSRLAVLAARTIDAQGGTVDAATMADFDCPSYNQDVQRGDGFPSGAVAWRDRLDRCDGLVIASPEYNFSMPGVLKNAIDWVSRFRPQPFNEKHALLLSASPSMVGGNRGLWALRIPLEHLGARVFPDMFSLAQAHTAFTDDGRLANPDLMTRFERTMRAFLDLAEAAKNYPCAKKAWFEFLGEQVDALTDRED